MQPCPRQAAATMGMQLAHQSHWEADGTCSYCGSLSPELFFKAIGDGCELGPTGKNYKVYVDRPDPDAGQPWIYSTANFEFKPGIGKITEEMFDQTKMPPAWKESYVGQYGRIEPKDAIKHDKFYFYHLNEEEMHRFIELYNRRNLNIGVPGDFYVLPYFMTRKK